VITEETGKFQPITFVVGVSTSFEAVDVAVMTYRETHGDAVKGRRFLNQFRGLGTDDPVRRNQDITNISGATISVDSMCRGVRRVLVMLETLGRAALDQEPKKLSEKRLVMGALCTITAYGPDETAARAAVGRAFDAIKAADALLSDYNEKSELSRLNAAGEAKVSPELLAFLKRATECCDASGGAFDVTVGALMRQWGFRGGKARQPADEELKRAREARGFRIDGENVTLTKGALLDPGGLGKGWAVDRAVAELKKSGISAATVDFGSTVHALGAPPGASGWVVGIRDPFDSDRLIGTVTLKDESLSTSGSYERFVEIDGEKFCHILDPRSGRPVAGMASVSVVGPSGSETDFLSTSLFVLGVEGGTALAAKRKAEALWVATDAKRAATPGWAGRFKERKE
jgi:thiamine biosynthesis lipoprotein